VTVGKPGPGLPAQDLDAEVVAVREELDGAGPAFSRERYEREQTPFLLNLRREGVPV